MCRQLFMARLGAGLHIVNDDVGERAANVDAKRIALHPRPLEICCPHTVGNVRAQVKAVDWQGDQVACNQAKRAPGSLKIEAIPAWAIG